MNQIRRALGDHYLMFYHPKIDVESLMPEQTLDGCIRAVNQARSQFGAQWDQWPWESRNNAARLVRVNWIYQRLVVEPIRKPILTYCRQKKLHVLCGDTRIMSLGLLTVSSTVAVMTTCRIEQKCFYQDWVRVDSDQQLIQLLDFDPATTQIFFTASAPSSDHAIDWFEIGDSSTIHHLHDEDRCWQAFCQWAQQHPDLEFSADWARSKMAWSDYGL